MFFLFNDPATTEIYTLSLHDALPICFKPGRKITAYYDTFVDTESPKGHYVRSIAVTWAPNAQARSEEHTSELQSLRHLVCRLLLEKKKKKKIINNNDEYHDNIQTHSS